MLTLQSLIDCFYKKVTYRMMLFLRTAMGVLEYPTRGIPNWKVPELNGVELDFVLNNLLYHPQNTHYAMLPRCEYEENMRVPILIGALVRKSIVEHTKRLPKPLEMPEELKLLSSVDDCISAFAGIRKFNSTPVPFPVSHTSQQVKQHPYFGYSGMRVSPLTSTP